MTEDYDPTQEIRFQDDEEMEPEVRHHILDAAAHHAGHGPHPGHKKRHHQIRENEDQQDREEPTEGTLQRLREEEYPEMMGMEQGQQKGPVPPSEALPAQPPISGKGGKPGPKPPSQGTPAAIGHAAVAQPPPAGEF
jgi:hypothetical protein